MIIKVETPGIEDKNGHWLFSNVVRYNVFEYSKDSPSWNSHEARMCHESDTNKRKYLLIHMHLDDESTYCVATDDAVWVMNDKGDTIQKLIA